MMFAVIDDSDDGSVSESSGPNLVIDAGDVGILYVIYWSSDALPLLFLSLLEGDWHAELLQNVLQDHYNLNVAE